MNTKVGYSINGKAKVGYSINELNRANNDIDADYCTDCGMSVTDENFTWHRPEATSDEQMHQEW